MHGTGRLANIHNLWMNWKLPWKFGKQDLSLSESIFSLCLLQYSKSRRLVITHDSTLPAFIKKRNLEAHSETHNPQKKKKKKERHIKNAHIATS